MKNKRYPVKYFEGIYEVDKSGNIYSLIKNKYLKPCITPEGYKQVVLCKEGKHFTKKIHRIVGLSIINNPENFPALNHKDGNKLNNNIENLEWCTFSHNRNHAVKTGLHVSRFGINHPRAKLTEEQVKEIRKFNASNACVAQLFNVSITVIRNIKSFKSWKHIPL